MSDYKLTIYAESEGPFGHFSVGVTGPGIDEPIAGKYMRDESLLDKAGAVMGGAPGAVRDDSGKKGKGSVVEQSIPLTKEEAERAAAHIAATRANPDAYQLFDQNCIDFVEGTIAAAGKDARIDQLFDDEVLDAMGKGSPYGAGDQAQRRGRITDIGEISKATKPGAERRKAIRDYWDSEGDKSEMSGPDGDKMGGEAPAESPEVAKFKANLMPSEKEGARAELLHKSADQLTNDEVTDLGHWFHDLQPSDPMRSTLDQKRRDFYSLTYGDEPAKADATGRMIEPMAKRSVPEQSTPAKAASGGTLMDGIERIAGGLASAVEADGEGEVVKGLQTGLNLAGQSLKVDGIAGPKTRAGLMQTLAEKGMGKTEEAAALGRLKRFAETERAQGGSASGLKDTVAKSVQSLLGAEHPGVAAEALQMSLNGLIADAAQAKKSPVPEPLKIDGDIGPKTTDAFRLALMDHGPDLMTKRFGAELGFL